MLACRYMVFVEDPASVTELANSEGLLKFGLSSVRAKFENGQQEERANNASGAGAD